MRAICTYANIRLTCMVRYEMFDEQRHTEKMIGTHCTIRTAQVARRPFKSLKC